MSLVSTICFFCQHVAKLTTISVCNRVDAAKIGVGGVGGCPNRFCACSVYFGGVGNAATFIIFVLFFQPKALGQTLLSEVFFRGNLIESDYFGLEFQNMQMNWVCKAAHVRLFNFKTCCMFTALCQNSQLDETILSIVSDGISASLARAHTHILALRSM